MKNTSLRSDGSMNNTKGLKKVSFKLFPDDILLCDIFKTFEQSPKIEIYCKNISEILLNDNQKEKMKTFFRNREYNLAVRMWLKIFERKDLIEDNKNEILNLVKYCKDIGAISKKTAKNLERLIIMKNEVIIADEKLTVNFSQTKYNKFLERKKILDNSKILNNMNVYNEVRECLKIFRELGFHKSRKFFKNFREYIKKIRHKLVNNEYSNIMKSFRNNDELRRKKREYDHFPPDFIYRFAKDIYIKKLRYSERPGWHINRGLHRKSISTGYSKKTIIFNSLQRDLFSQGKYYEALKNYIIKYIEDRIINVDNKDAFGNVLYDCVKVGLINNQQYHILIDSITKELNM
jgi:hypothetical protein